jgi:Cdc6-like AAA superfamily ATPase
MSRPHILKAYQHLSCSFLPALRARGFAPKVVVFPPYSAEQIAAIVSSRLATVPPLSASPPLGSQAGAARLAAGGGSDVEMGSAAGGAGANADTARPPGGGSPADSPSNFAIGAAPSWPSSNLLLQHRASATTSSSKRARGKMTDAAPTAPPEPLPIMDPSVRPNRCNHIFVYHAA